MLNVGLLWLYTIFSSISRRMVDFLDPICFRGLVRKNYTKVEITYFEQTGRLAKKILTNSILTPRKIVYHKKHIITYTIGFDSLLIGIIN